MKLIYRYAVPIDDQRHEIALHWRASIVHVGFSRSHRTSDGFVDFWAIVDPEASIGLFRRTFTVVDTGHQVPYGFHHVGTYVDPELALVCHLLEQDYEAPF